MVLYRVIIIDSIGIRLAFDYHSTLIRRSFVAKIMSILDEMALIPSYLAECHNHICIDVQI